MARGARAEATVATPCAARRVCSLRAQTFITRKERRHSALTLPTASLMDGAPPGMHGLHFFATPSGMAQAYGLGPGSSTGPVMMHPAQVRASALCLGALRGFPRFRSGEPAVSSRSLRTSLVPSH